MPEECNRIVTYHLADMLFVTEESGIENLKREGIAEDKIHFVGNTMIDTLLAFEKKADQSGILEKLGLRNHGCKSSQSSNGKIPFALLTLHRPSNVDDRETFVHIAEALSELASDLPVVFPVHPRTRQRVKEFGLEPFFCNGNPNEAIHKEGSCTKGKIVLIDPLGYLDFLCLMKNARIVLTDSGGIQEETTCLGVPCITIRENTERPVTVTHGTNVLARVNKSDLKEAFDRQLRRSFGRVMPKNWDGMAAVRIIDIIRDKVTALSPIISSRTSISPSGGHQNNRQS
jgi:UDP-N-acetylglucosamine 2-epimerase (non-hydrolysing)